MPGMGDIAAMYVSENEVRLMSLREELDGKLFGVMWNPEEKIDIPEDKISSLHRVVQISFL